MQPERNCPVCFQKVKQYKDHDTIFECPLCKCISGSGSKGEVKSIVRYASTDTFPDEDNLQYVKLNVLENDDCIEGWVDTRTRLLVA